MAKIRNKITGEVIDVPDDQLGNYGLSKPTMTMSNGASALQQPTPTQPSPTNSDSSEMPKTITGHTIEEHAQALNAAKAAGDTAAAKQITDDYNREYQYQKEFIQPDLQKKKEDQAKTESATKEAKSLMEATLQNYLNVPENQKGQIEGMKANIPILNGMIAPEGTEYEAGLKGEAPALAKVFGGAGSGLRITQAEINSWMPFFPSIHKTDAQNRADVQKLNVIMKGRFGAGLDPEILNQYGLDDNGKPVNSGSGKGEKFVKNAGEDIAGLAIGVGELAKNANGPLVGLNFRDPKQDVLQTKNMAGGIADEYKNLITNPAQHFTDHPINTVLDILPILAGGRALLASRAAKAGEAGESASGASFASGESPIISSEIGPVKNLTRNLADVINGGGSKEYIARGVGSKNFIPQKQVLMDENILMHPTETGRIQATKVALNKHGQTLADLYKNSDRVFKGDSLGKIIESGLKEGGYDPKAVEYIKRYINNQGNIDISNLDNLISMEKAWQIAQKLEKNPPKGFGKTAENTASLRDLSKDTARIIRTQLSDKVPESNASAARYGALRDYMDNILSDPKGADANAGEKGIVGAVTNLGKSVINPALNIGYKTAAPFTDVVAKPVVNSVRKLVRDMRFKQGNPVFRSKP